MIYMVATTELTRAYRAALLLTASTRGAEAAVTRAIDKGCSAILRNTIVAALDWRGPADAASCAAPPLGWVLTLPRAQRQCFVLRVLEGLPAGRCGALLEMSPDEVNRAAANVAAAHRALSAMLARQYDWPAPAAGAA